MPFSLLPKVMAPSLTALTPDLLEGLGVRLLMLDFDNTIVPYTTNVPTPEMAAWLEKMNKLEDIRLCIVSNSHKARVPAFSEAYGVACVNRAAKPGTRGIREAMERFGAKQSETALVGDQIYTDVLGAKRAGVTALIVKSIHNHTIWLKLRHLLEVPVLAMARKRRVQL